MNWHTRYLQQANWTRGLRAYLFEKTGLTRAGRVLEVGCGTGAILADISTRASLHGLDLDPAALAECRIHAPAVDVTTGDALLLPYQDALFDITYCHFLLLWVKDPSQALREMKRVTKSNGNILAFAEPDYTNRIDEPEELAALGKWQMDALKRQGADPSFGARLAESFYEAGIKLIETGPIQSQGLMRDADERQQEWAVIESDLAGWVPAQEIQKMKVLDLHAWAKNIRVLQVPTYFAWGIIS
ncbi:MAG: methyltransferase domain-containing protein [Anaerolineales bacterium]|nr:methyltransferase domain-containing protein [Anaerolineales bacterium]